MRIRGGILAACLALLIGCDGAVAPDAGSVSDGGGGLDAGSSDAGGVDAGRADAGVDAATDDAGLDAGLADAGSPSDFVVDVVVRSPDTGRYEPTARVFVRVSGADGSMAEAETDASGRVTVTLEPTGAPWTVTAASPGHTATSIIGVTGPLDGAIHLSRNDAAMTSRTVSGSIFGRTTTGEGLYFDGPGHGPRVLTGDTYELPVYDEPTPLRLLVLEWEMPFGSPPNNAVWLDIDRSLSDLSGIDVTFPDPPRAVVDTTMRVTVPTTGAVDASAFAPPMSGVAAARWESGYAYAVGRAGAVADGSGGFDVTVQAFDGDMAPSHIGLTLTDGPDTQIIATAPVAGGSTFDVPAAERIAAAGATVGELVLTWNAPAYAHVGASLTPAGGGGGWFIYSYGAEPIEVSAPWPELPSGVAFGDLMLGPSSVGRINTFVITYEVGVRPWEWGRLREARAIVTAADVELTGR